MDSNPEFTLQEFCRAQGKEVGRTFWVGYSGGMDSHVLLHLLAKVRAELGLSFSLKAVHINHSLSPHAEKWAAHCAAVCCDLQIDFVSHTVQAKADVGDSPEEIAREKRYEVLGQLLGENDILLTAHHQDDQAETLLLQLFRGAGPKGLSAMPALKKFGSGFQARPLLNITRAKLLNYATENHLMWIEDESNDNTHFSRNFIRHDVLSVLKNRWPAISATLSRSASHCAEAQSLLDEMAFSDFAAGAGSATGTLSVSFLLTLSAARQRQLLRFWLKEQNYSVPDTVKLQQIQREILHARVDKCPHIAWKDTEVRRYRDDIHAMKRLALSDPSQILRWDLQSPLNINPVGVLHANLATGIGLNASLKNITVRFRQGGEMCQLPKRNCTHSLKKLFWAWNIPPWERTRMPLIFVADKFAALPGYFVTEEFAAQKQEEGYVFSFEKII
jgi:tRNA(Ile)-lysidine synthase